MTSRTQYEYTKMYLLNRWLILKGVPEYKKEYKRQEELNRQIDIILNKRCTSDECADCDHMFQERTEGDPQNTSSCPNDI